MCDSSSDIRDVRKEAIHVACVTYQVSGPIRMNMTRRDWSKQYRGAPLLRLCSRERKCFCFFPSSSFPLLVISATRLPAAIIIWHALWCGRLGPLRSTAFVTLPPIPRYPYLHLFRVLAGKRSLVKEPDDVSFADCPPISFLGFLSSLQPKILPFS